jgi:hypothetical protein
MVHKTKTTTDEMDSWINDMDRQQDNYIKSLEADMKRQEDDFKAMTREAEATAIGTYEAVKGLGESAVRTGQKIKTGVATAKIKFGEIERGAKEVFGKIRGAKIRPKWYEREPIRVGISPEILKKRAEEEKKYVRIE